MQIGGSQAMDKKAIEILAVNAARDSIVLSDYLDQFIADNDKEPSWDGFVYIYKSKVKKRKTSEDEFLFK